MSQFKDKVNSEGYEEFTIKLPVGYSYEKFSEITENDINFYCNELVADAEIQRWVKELGEQNYVEWRVARTHPQVVGVKCLYRKDYRCQHSSTWYEPNPKASKPRKTKNKKCPSKLSIRRIQKSKYDGGKVSTLISLRNQHNHPTGSMANLKFRDVGEKAKQRLKELFENGHTPSDAHQVLQSETLEEFGDDDESVVADRNKVPDLSYCYNAFYKVMKEGHGSLQGKPSNNVETGGETPCTNSTETNHIEDSEDTVMRTTDSVPQENHTQELNSVTKTLKNVFDDLVFKLSSTESPELLIASKGFCENYHTLCNRENVLQSALFNFGR